MKHCIAINQFAREDFESLIARAAEFEANGYPKVLENAVVASLFFEPSTRTRLSFESAVARLGGSVIGVTDPATSSAKKGETLEDTIRMMNAYADAIVMRHPEAGSAERAASVATVPFINAGDGAHEHPTQTLIDLFAMHKAFGKIDGLKVALIGDLRYGRVPHSLAKALSQFNVTQYWVAPEELEMPQEVEDVVTSEVVKYSCIEDCIADADVLYMTRVQQERFASEADYEKVKDVYILTPEMVQKAKPGMRIFHALPRRFEIPEEIDALPNAFYFEQAAGGVAVRAALLEKLVS